MDKQEFFDKQYMPQMNRIGKVTGYLGVVLSFLPAVALAVFYGLLPQWGALVTAFVSGAAAFGALWFVEPISYFPVVGTVGTYMAFLSGNISNMRIPCASVAQASCDVKPGTPEGNVIATLGMATSIVINVAVLTIGVILGEKVLEMLPAGVKLALSSYLLPALFGALLMQFAMSKVSLSVIADYYSIVFRFVGKSDGDLLGNTKVLVADNMCVCKNVSVLRHYDSCACARNILCNCI